jgi:hypothetical protein
MTLNNYSETSVANVAKGMFTPVAQDIVEPWAKAI